MAGDPQIDTWRRRATALVSDSTGPFNRLLQALPRLLMLGRDYSEAAKRYVRIYGMENDRKVLGEIEEKAVQRVRLMAERYRVTQQQVHVEGTLRRLNAQILAVQIAIAAGKLAELYLGAHKYLGQTLELVDEAKLAIDAAKTGAAYADGTRRGVADDPAADTAAISVALRVLPGDMKNLSKVLWDASSTIRRERSARSTEQNIALAANALKGILDQLVVIGEYFKRNPKLLKETGAALGAIRDVIDAGIAFVAAFNAIKALYVSVGTVERQIEEGWGYLGYGEHVLQPTHGGYSHQLPHVVVAKAGDWATARILAADAKRESERLLQEISAADSLYWHEMTHLYVALRKLQPDLNATEMNLQLLSEQIVNLSFAINRKDSRAASAKLIQDNLVGFRAQVASIFLQVQSLLLPTQLMTRGLGPVSPGS